MECNANITTLQDWKARVLNEYPDTQFVETREEFDKRINEMR
jgi:hypothetical protein